MRNVVLAGLAGFGAVLCAVQAGAQPAAADWSGFYGGLNAGWNWGHISGQGSALTVNQLSGLNAGAGTGAVSVPPATFFGNRADQSRGGFQGGGQIGFNRAAGPVVWGLEGDFDGLTQSYTTFESVNLPPTALTTGANTVAIQRVTPKWTTSIRGRVGMPFGRSLLYVTGGPAWIRMRQVSGYTYSPTVTNAVAAANPGAFLGPFTNSTDTSDTRRGWTVGAGAELMHTQNMTFGLEYRHTWADDFSSDAPTSAPNSVFETGRFQYRDNAVLARVNVKFGALHNPF
jgi:opacity protein-like surface antigen